MADRKMFTDAELLELADRVTARPSTFASLLAGLGAFVLFGMAGHLLCDLFNASEAMRDRSFDASLVAFVWAFWRTRYEPLTMATDALRARAAKDNADG